MPTRCLAPLGMKDKTIQDLSITASSAQLDPNGRNDRCDNVFAYNGSVGRLDANTSWLPFGNDVGPWVQVDFGYCNVKRVNGIITQGSNYWDGWVQTLQVQYGMRIDTLTPIRENRVPKV